MSLGSMSFSRRSQIKLHQKPYTTRMSHSNVVFTSLVMNRMHEARILNSKSHVRAEQRSYATHKLLV